MANQLCLLRPLHWFVLVPAGLPRHALFPSTERRPLVRSSLVAVSTGEEDNKSTMSKRVWEICVSVCVCVWCCVVLCCVCCCVQGAVTTTHVWGNVSWKNFCSFIATLTCVNAKYILSICFCSRTDCSDWSGSKRTHSWYIIGNRRFMASFSGPRSSGFLYLWENYTPMNSERLVSNYYCWSGLLCFVRCQTGTNAVFPFKAHHIHHSHLLTTGIPLPSITLCFCLLDNRQFYFPKQNNITIHYETCKYQTLLWKSTK
jgi:hypothetical protein